MQFSFPATKAKRYEGLGYGSSHITSCLLCSSSFALTRFPLESKTGKSSLLASILTLYFLQISGLSEW